MAKFLIEMKWSELHSSQITIEANSLEEAEEYMEDNIVEKIFEEKGFGDTYDELEDNSQEYNII